MATGTLLAVSTGLKLLLFRSYRSTDFEVHRHWLWITHTLPLREWYHDTSSEWTLDYPPLFAYFERALAAVAYLLQPAILSHEPNELDATVVFQRSSVVLTELVLAAALYHWAKRSKSPDFPTASLIAASILLHPALLIVDHIHFQYNGFLLGILLFSILAARADQLHLCAFLFAVLLNFKHIFIYLAPPYFVFLLRRHCFSPTTGKFRPDRLVELGVIVIAVFAVSFGPFVYVGGIEQLQQIASRLFPFQRGLNHAYWAGNFWALYSVVDRVLVKYLTHRGITISAAALASSSRGLVGTTTFGVLPDITPTHTFALTASFLLLYMTKLWFDPTYKRFLDSVVLSALTSFLWGWHVHEKAVLLFLVPLSLTATNSNDHFRAYVIATTAGILSLFPLLINSAETPIKIIFTVIWLGITFSSLRKVVYQPLPNLFTLLALQLEQVYLAGFVLLQLYVSVGHELLFPPTEQGGMEFLPLMLTSVYCAGGISWAWLRLSWVYMRN